MDGLIISKHVNWYLLPRMKTRRSKAFFTLFNELEGLDPPLPFTTLSIFLFLCKWKDSGYQNIFPTQVQATIPECLPIFFGVSLENSTALFSRIGLPLLCTFLCSNIFSELLWLQYFYLFQSGESLFCSQLTQAMFNCTIYFLSINAAAIVYSWRHK